MRPSPQSLGTAIVVVLFVAIGALGISTTLKPLRRTRSGVNATTDEIAATIFGTDGGADAVIGSAANLPAEKPILVIGPGDDWTLSEAYYTISYLLWPKEVWALGAARGGAPSPYTFLPREKIDPGGIFLYAVQPPEELRQTAKPLGAKLILAAGAPSP